MNAHVTVVVIITMESATNYQNAIVLLLLHGKSVINDKNVTLLLLQRNCHRPLLCYYYDKSATVILLLLLQVTKLPSISTEVPYSVIIIFVIILKNVPYTLLLRIS